MCRAMCIWHCGNLGHTSSSDSLVSSNPARAIDAAGRFAASEFSAGILGKQEVNRSLWCWIVEVVIFMILTFSLSGVDIRHFCSSVLH